MAEALADAALHDLADRLVRVPGVVAVALGGSRARGDATAESDVDLGLYYEPPLDVAALRRLARAVGGPGAELVEPGAWGPWVDGGGWLQVDGVAVDWLYRDLGRVRAAWADASAGRYAWHAQVGHPLGVPDFAYAGEVAISRVLADPTGQLIALQLEAQVYPPVLAAALARGLWEAGFDVAIARKALPREDTAYAAGCLFRAVLLCAHAVAGRAGCWLVNEKGAVAAAGRSSAAPAGFAERAHGVLASLGTDRPSLAAAVEAADELVRDVRAALDRPG